MTSVYHRGPERKYPLSLASTSGKITELRKVQEKRSTHSTHRSMNETLTMSREHSSRDHARLTREAIGSSRDNADSHTGYLISPRKRSVRRSRPTVVHEHHGEIITESRGLSTLTHRSSSQDSDSSEQDKKLRTSHMKLIRRQQRKQLYDKFRLVARMAVLCAKLGKAYILRNKVYDEIAPYLNSLHFYDYDAPVEGVDLMFDPSQFKADKQLRLSEEAIRILSMPCSERTDKELYHAQLALRNNKAFSDYPVRMQRKIVEVGYYEKFGAKRVIVRQGYPAHAFYFILSGSIVVMVSENNTKVAKPVAYLSRGAAFGELAIINRTNRQATVVGKSTLELLSIDIESFHKIFMAGGVKNIHDPDYNDFMRSLTFLKGWPIEILSEEPTKCIFHYFKRGDIMVKDTNYSDWIFVVKSGSVQVLKKLKRVDPYEWLKKEKSNLNGKKRKQENEIRGEKELREKQRRFVLPEINIPKKDPEEVEDREVNSGRMVHTPLFAIERVWGANSPPAAPLPPLIGINISESPDSRHPSAISRESTNLNRPQTSCSGRISSSQLKRRESSPSALHGKTAVTSVKSYDDDVAERHRKGLKSSKKKKGQQKKKKNQDEEEFEKEINRKQELRTINDDFDSKFRMKNDSELTEADFDPQFVTVQTLLKGQVFGVAETVLGKQPSFCVVSSGAECVMIDKLYYLRHAPDDLLRKIRQECCPYPSDEDMQEELQTTVDWAAYKDANFKNTLKYLYMKNTPRDAPL